MILYKYMKNLIKIYILAIVAVLALPSCSAVKNLKDEMTAEKRFSIALESFRDGDYVDSEVDFLAVIDSFPLSPYAIESQLLLADTYFALEEYEEASSYYTTFVTLHPGHKKAEYGLFQKGMSHFKNISTIDRDQRETRRALFAFRDLLTVNSESLYSDKANKMIVFLNERLAEREFYVGKFYFKDEKYFGALSRFRNILRDYSDTEVVDKTLYYITETYVSLGEWDLAKGAYASLLDEFPESPYIDMVSMDVSDS